MIARNNEKVKSDTLLSHEILVDVEKYVDADIHVVDLSGVVGCSLRFYRASRIRTNLASQLPTHSGFQYLANISTTRQFHETPTSHRASLHDG